MKRCPNLPVDAVCFFHRWNCGLDAYSKWIHHTISRTFSRDAQIVSFEGNLINSDSVVEVAPMFACSRCGYLSTNTKIIIP